MMRLSRSRALASITPLLVILAFVAAPGAQTSNATLQGTITDSSGSVLPGVSVKLESPATGLTRDIVTNVSGVYVFNFLPAGTYVIAAELSGFKTARHDQVRLEIGQNLELDLRMEIGQLSEIVTVESTAAPLDRTSPAIGTVIEASQLKELPLAGRHWAGLMLLAPGAINTGDGTHLSTRFVGRSRDDNNWTFDASTRPASRIPGRTAPHASSSAANRSPSSASAPRCIRPSRARPRAVRCS